MEQFLPPSQILVHGFRRRIMTRVTLLVTVCLALAPSGLAFKTVLNEIKQVMGMSFSYDVVHRGHARPASVSFPFSLPDAGIAPCLTSSDLCVGSVQA